MRVIAGLGACLSLLCAGHAPAQELRWYRGNTHTHTVNSDGDTAPDAVARWYKEHGYQFLFITDHEFITDVAPLNAIFAADERFLLLPGQRSRNGAGIRNALQRMSTHSSPAR